MIDARILDYDFDEEAQGFGAPEPTAGRTVPAFEWIGIAILFGGLASLLAQVFGHRWNGTWLGFWTAYGGLSGGGMLMFWARYKDTEPGIKHDGVMFSSWLSRGALGWIMALAFTALYVCLYWYPSVIGYVPGTDTEPARVSGLVLTVDPLARLMTGGGASQWFLYGVLYCLAMLTFAVRMYMKYRHSRYQLVRTTSVLFFQIFFAFLLSNLLILFKLPYYELNGVWPLKYDYLWPDKISSLWSSDAPHGAFGIFLVFWSFMMVLVGTPILTYFYGKRWYCSWVCGCGGLAETLGDGYRQLSDKSTRAWKIERWVIHSVLIFILVVTVFLWVDWPYRYQLKQWYGFLIGATFSGVVGVGFYPLLGSRVWCRFGCPQAAILGLLQRYFSRFRITTNGGQCMSCGNCSTYCEMGIDVRAYAQQGKNIIRASCVGCGVCSAVCPRGVLKLENGATSADRYEGADTPVSQFLADLRQPPKA